MRMDWFLRCCTRNGNVILPIGVRVPESGVRSWDALPSPSRRDVPKLPLPELNSQTLMTPRQRELSTEVELPELPVYPILKGKVYASEEERKLDMLTIFKQFVLELHAGKYLTQLTSTSDYSEIHCQLMDDLRTLKLDQRDGRIIEFPLNAVSKVYRIVKNEDRWYTSSEEDDEVPTSNPTDHIVVVEFMRRKLAFVHDSMEASQQFLMCIEFLIRKAQIGTAVRSR